MKDAFWLSLYTGGRSSDIVELRWCDIVYDATGKPMCFNSSDDKFNRSHNHLVTEDERKIKQFMIYEEFKEFLELIGHQKYKHSNQFVLAPKTAIKRETMAGTISKAFTQFMSKTDIKEKFVFKNLRKTFSTNVRCQFGDLAHHITGHEGIGVMDKHYADKSLAQNKMRNEFKVFEN